jgi:hypothetical protein
MLNKKHILMSGALLCTGNCLFPSTFKIETYLHHTGVKFEGLRKITEISGHFFVLQIKKV